MKQGAVLFVKLFSICLFVVFYYLISLQDLNTDVINPDGINWHTRTRAFTEALSKGIYSDTFQTYHPGTTLMWVSGPLLNLFKTPIDSSNTDPKATFLTRDYYAKLSVVAFGTFVFVLTLIVLWKLVGFKYVAFYSVVYTLEPFVIGMRRLYHLDFLMTSLIFLSFLLLIYFNYKSPKWLAIVFSGLFFALALLTKSTAIIFLPAIPFIFWLGNNSVLKKLSALLLFIVATLLFVYAFFPPIWRHPIKQVPRYYNQIVFGITDIGVNGRKEMGTSGKGDNILLDDTFKDKGPNFYIRSLFMRLSIAGGVVLVVASGVFIYFILKGFVLLIWKTIKNKSIPKTYNFASDSWISFWSIVISIAVLIALTLAVKKSDRYEILVFPFLLTIVAYFYNKLKLYLSLPLISIYACFVVYELIPLHPYYLAYSNPYLGGIETRLRALDDAPFGIGSYAAFDIVKNDREASGYDGYYTVSGSKSIKAISVGGRFSRFPSCVTDYVITYALEDQPTYTCVQKYTLLGKVKISGFDYWYVYKRLHQKHESNYE